MQEIKKGSNWIHLITNEFVTVLGVEGHMVDYQDNCGQKGRQGVEWFLSSYNPLPVTQVVFPQYYIEDNKDKSFAIIEGDYWEDNFTHELVKIKEFKHQVVSYYAFDGLLHMHNESTFRHNYTPKHLLGSLNQ